MAWLLELRRQIAIPHTLAEIGIDDTRADIIGKMATEDPSAGGNPIAFNAVQYRRIFTNAVTGNL